MTVGPDLAAVDTASRITLDDQGRVVGVALAEPDPQRAAERLCTLLGELLGTDLRPVGLELRAVMAGHLAIVSIREQPPGGPPQFHAGTALASEPATAMGQAACEALLRDDGGNVALAGARRAVGSGLATGAHLRIGGADHQLGADIDPDVPAATLRLADATITMVPAGADRAPAVEAWLTCLRAAAGDPD